ncbi:MAG: helix-turn-helix domain-containing protein [Opitutaceae bacterium]
MDRRLDGGHSEITKGGEERRFSRAAHAGYQYIYFIVKGAGERLKIWQLGRFGEAAELLSVSRATIWRMTKDCVLHPVEIIPGTWRYPFREIITLARKGVEAVAETPSRREKSAA